MAGLGKLGLTLAVASLCATMANAADQRSAALNQNAVGLLAAEARWMPNALEIADSIQHEDSLRILPMVGIGAVQAVNDLAFLQSVDAALIPADTVTYAKLQGLMQGLDGKIAYLARLSQIEFVLVTTIEVNSLTELAGKRVATGPAQSAAFATGELILGMMEVPFLRVPRQGKAALQALIRGHADAALVTTADIGDMAVDRARFHVLPLPVPASLEETYVPAILTPDDVPALIGSGEAIETVSTSLALAVFNWPARNQHYDKLRRLSEALFAASNEISAGGDQPINLSASIPNLTRHASAAEVLGLSADGGTTSDNTLQPGDGQ